MAQIPIQTGVQVKDGSFRTSYPVNLQHKIVESGVSKGELVSAYGARQLSVGNGVDRGGVVWNGVHYRMMGDKFVRVATDGTITQVASFIDDGLTVRFAYGFDRLGIASGERLYYFDGSTLTKVTDTDLGPVIDLAWLGGYFITTDGSLVVVTDLNNPSSVDPLKYGSAESDPDDITGLETLGEELIAFGRHSTQFFRNVGGTGFPFQAVVGATIPYGCVSARAKCRVANTIAFVGGGRDEPLGVFVLAGGTAVRISDEEIEQRLNNSSSETAITMERRSFGHEEQVIVHLEDCSLALSVRGSEIAEDGLWHVLESRRGRYRPRNAVLYQGRHFVGDFESKALGVLDDAITAHFGEEPHWSFDVGLLYQQEGGAIVREVEITGQFPASPTAVFFSMTYDGETWSREVARHLTGSRGERVLWRPNVRMPRLMGARFRGSSKVAIARCDVAGEPLAA